MVLIDNFRILHEKFTIVLYTGPQLYDNYYRKMAHFG